MELIDFIVIGIIAAIVGGAVAYIIKAKRSGKGCIGCPDSATCGARRKAKNHHPCTSCNSCPNCSACKTDDEKKS